MSSPSRTPIDNIAIEPPLKARPTMRIGEILGKMKELRLWAVPVVDDKDRVIGIISYRSILMRGAGRDTKVLTVMEPPYMITSGTPFLEAVAKIVTWKARAVPIVDDRRHLLAIITRENVLKFMVENNLVPPQRADEVMSTPPITIHEDESIARARWLMLKSGISRLPVVDDEDRLVGVISLRDIVERLYTIKLTRRKGFEWIRSEEEFLAAPVKDFMSSPPIYVARNTSLYDVIRTLLEYKISGVPVTEREKVVGVLSGLDIMKRYVEMHVEVRPIEAKIASTIAQDEVLKLQVEKLLNDYLSSLQRMVNVIDLKVNLKEETKTEKTEGRRRYRVRIRLVTDEGTFVAEGIGWEVLTALRDALMILEKRVKKILEKKRLYLPEKEEL